MGHPLPPAHSCNDRAQCFFDQPVSSKRRSTLRCRIAQGVLSNALEIKKLFTMLINTTLLLIHIRDTQGSPMRVICDRDLRRFTSLNLEFKKGKRSAPAQWARGVSMEAR
jgi:hypothetical protein